MEQGTARRVFQGQLYEYLDLAAAIFLRNKKIVCSVFIVIVHAGNVAEI